MAFVDSLIEAALEEAGIEKKAETSTPSSDHQRLVDILQKVAKAIEVKTAAKGQDMLDKKINTELSEIFTGNDIDEKTIERRKAIKKRLEELGGLAAPSL